MKHIFSFVFLCFIFIFRSNAQELVPNGSFEMMKRMPNKETNYIYCTEYWQTPSATNADYYSTKEAFFAIERLGEESKADLEGKNDVFFALMAFKPSTPSLPSKPSSPAFHQTALKYLRLVPWKT